MYIIYLLNWLDRDNVAPGGTFGWDFPPKDLFGDSKSAAIDNPWPNFLGDSKVLWPLLGEAIGEFWLLADWYRCGKDLSKSMVTFRKKSQTDKFRPKSLADLYLQKKSLSCCFNSIEISLKKSWKLPTQFDFQNV